ncbi:MAG: hypothetical protein DHS20C11_37100 [Lysobacteraceae bacterium]|nr:MAG: hypothetical protein DHS20C11_37100 [Xanthomonadaceae bacterium]
MNVGLGNLSVPVTTSNKGVNDKNGGKAVQIDTRHLLSVDCAITPQEQAVIIEQVHQQGRRKAGLDDQSPVYWNTLLVTDIDPESIPPRIRSWLAEHPEKRTSWTYLSRLDPSLAWRWVESPASDAIRSVLQRMPPVFKKITRVKVFLQIPGQAIAPHRDLVVGNTYEQMRDEQSADLGAQTMMYIGRRWIRRLRSEIANTVHHEHGYLSLKIPLSEKPPDSGLPYIQPAHRRLYFNTKNRLYFINEYQGLHGAEAVNFWRGVVFVDGFLDPHLVDQLRHNCPSTMAWMK